MAGEYLEFNNNTIPALSAPNMNLMQQRIRAHINSLNEYSTTEQQIGTWIDKPLYQKIITSKTGTSADTWKVITNSNDINKLINVKGYMLADTGRTIPFATPYQAIWFDVDENGNLRIAAHGDSLLNKDIEICIEYTKTTD